MNTNQNPAPHLSEVLSENRVYTHKVLALVPNRTVILAESAGQAEQIAKALRADLRAQGLPVRGMVTVSKRGR